MYFDLIAHHFQLSIVKSFRLASLVPKLGGGAKESHGACYLKSCDQLTSLSALKDGCVSLLFTADFVSAINLRHRQATRSVDLLPSLVAQELQLYSPTLIIIVLLPFYSWLRAHDFRSQAL